MIGSIAADNAHARCDCVVMTAACKGHSRFDGASRATGVSGSLCRSARE